MEQLVGLTSVSVLPFVGREAEMNRLMNFWRDALDAEEMRAALLVGEAGVGKSRLIGEMTPRIAAAGGIIVHLRLVPESATAIVPLLAQGLIYSEAAQALLRSDPEETLSSVTSALRRLVRLRPTLLIIEDLHLLAGDALRDLALLLDTLAGESFVLLATSRPVTLPARPSLERMLVETIRLEGLDRQSIAELWRGIFTDTPERGIVELLASVTAGNPLALRSVLRSLVRDGAVEPGLPNQAPRMRSDIESRSRLLRASVDFLAEGMVSHLAGEEREAASMLASLGELFALESALLLLADRPSLIDRLQTNGIIARSGTMLATIDNGRSASDPIAFTHTLLHQHLLSTASTPLDHLISIIASDAPLFSVVPFRLLARSDSLDHIPSDRLRSVIDRVVAVSFHLDSGPDWPLSEDVLSAGWRALRGLEGRIEADEYLRLRLTLLGRALASGRHSATGERYDELLREMLGLVTAQELPRELMSFRLRALYHKHLRCAESDPGRCQEVWEEVAVLCAEHPELELSLPYLYYLDDLARVALRMPDVPLLRRVDRKFEQLLGRPDLSEDLRTLALRGAATGLLLLFDTPEELEKRMALLEALPAEIMRDDPAVVGNRIALLETTGRMEEALTAARGAWERLSAAGFARNAAHCALIALCCRAGLGSELEALDQEIERCISAPGYTAGVTFRRNLAIYLTEIALLRGELDWAMSVQERLRPGTELYWPEGLVIIALRDGALAARLGSIELDEDQAEFAAIVRGVAAGAVDGDVEAAALPLLARPVLRLEDLLRLHATLHLLMTIGALSTKMRIAMQRALSDALDWTLSRYLLPLAQALLNGFGGLLTKKDADAALRRVKRLEERRRDRERKVEQGKVMVRMIGSVTVALPGAEPAAMRGFRMRTVLALLVGARMVKEPLMHRDFCRLAADGEDDPELARKTANMAVSRLREVIGVESVLVAEETYELNLDRVQVDLLEAWDLIEAARQALARRSLARAVPALIRAFDIVGGDVPFPGFYDEFFEALREDFEFRLRTTAIHLGRALLRESDAAGAETLLRRALQGLPGDEDIVDLLRSALEAGGKHAGSTMVGMSVARS